MVKVFALLPRRPDVTEAFFHEHWAGPHAELAKRISTMQTYVQSHRTEDRLSSVPLAPYEGIAEVRFEDAATAAGMGEDPAYLEGCHVDEPLFIDTDNLGFLATNEHVARPAPEPEAEHVGAKAMLLLARDPKLDPSAFGERIVAAAPAIADAVPGACRVSVSVALPESYADGAQPACDAVLELSFGRRGDVTEGVAPGLFAQLDGLADPVASSGLVAEELRVIWPGVAA